MHRTGPAMIRRGGTGHRHRRVVATAIAAAMALGACGGDDGADGSAPETPASKALSETPGPEAPATDASEAAYPRTIAHDQGETVIESRPERVVVLDAGMADAAIALGIELTGLPDYSSSGAALPDYLEDAGANLVAPDAFLGDVAEPNLEQLAALDPDVIVSTTSRHEDIYDDLAQIAPTVFSLEAPLFKDGLRLVAEVMGEEDLAETLIDGYEARAAAIGDEIEAANGAMPAVSVVRFVDDPTIRLYQVASYSGTVLQDVGLERPASQQGTEDAFVEVSLELTADADADVIFIATFADDAGVTTQSRAQFESNPLWSQLTGRKVDVDDAVWMGATGILGAQAMLDDIAAQFEVDPARDG